MHGDSNVWSAAQRQRNIYGFGIHAGFEGNYGSLAMTNSVSWYGHVLRREDGHILRSALDFEFKGGRGGQGGCEGGRLRRKYDGWFEKERCTCSSKWSVSVNKIAAG